jgi:ribosomal protein S18 acetylase RimI-like enzyme
MIAEILPADAAGLAAVKELFAEYGDSLGPEHLCLREFDRELAGLPGSYAPPGGGLWLARVDAEPAGCVALRPLGDGAGELKRLYLRPRCRGRRLGRALAEAAIGRARDAGHRCVRLDTFPGMAEAVALYRALGFREIAPYHPNSFPGVMFMELAL